MVLDKFNDRLAMTLTRPVRPRLLGAVAASIRGQDVREFDAGLARWILDLRAQRREAVRDWLSLRLGQPIAASAAGGAMGEWAKRAVPKWIPTFR